jgi:hypothetical protein
MQNKKRNNTKKLGRKPNVMSGTIFVKKKVKRETVRTGSDIHLAMEKKANKRHEDRTTDETRV